MRHQALHTEQELPLQQGRPNLLSLLFTHSCSLPSLKPQLQKCTIYVIYEKQGGWGGNIVKKKKKKSHSFFQQNLKPLCTELLHSLFYLLSYPKEKSQTENNKNCIFKNHHNIPIYYHPFRHFLYITYLHIRPNFFPKEFVEKEGRGARQTNKGDDDDDDKKVNLTDGLCLDGDVPPYRILSSVHVSGTSPQLSLLLSLPLSNEFTCAMEQGQWVFGANVPSLFSLLLHLLSP